MMDQWVHVSLMAGVAATVVLLAGCVGSGSHARRRTAPYPPVENRYGLRVELRILENDPENYNRTYKRPGPMPEGKPKYITIHNTWNVAPAIRERDYVNNRRDKRKVSYHYAVDEKCAIQLMYDWERAWHAGDGNGDGNRRSIGVEICRSRCVGEQEKLYRKAEENAVILAAWLLDQYDLPDSALKKHQDWSGKFCPHRILSEKRWPEFRNRVLQTRRKRR